MFIYIPQHIQLTKKTKKMKKETRMHTSYYGAAAATDGRFSSGGHGRATLRRQVGRTKAAAAESIRGSSGEMGGDEGAAGRGGRWDYEIRWWRAAAG
jgi:hypothetical protein